MKKYIYFILYFTITLFYGITVNAQSPALPATFSFEAPTWPEITPTVQTPEVSPANLTENGITFSSSGQMFINNNSSSADGTQGFWPTSFIDGESFTVESADGSEFDFQTVKFIVFTQNAGILKAEGFKNGMSTGVQNSGEGFGTSLSSGLNNVVFDDAVFNEVDKVVITSTSSGFGWGFNVFDELVLGVAQLPCAPSEGLTTFDGLAYASIPPTKLDDQGTLTAGGMGLEVNAINQSCWDIKAVASTASINLQINGDGSNGVGGSSSISVIGNTLDYTSFKSNNGEEFDLKSFYFRAIAGAPANVVAYTITGYKDGMLVSGATASGTVPGNTLTQVSTASNDNFNNVDEFRISATQSGGGSIAANTRFDDIEVGAPVVSPDVTVGLTKSDETCSGEGDGSITATVTTGTANYSYTWSNGAETLNTSATTNTITGLFPGTYTVTVTDANGKTDMKSIAVGTIVDATDPTIASIADQTLTVNANCSASLPDYTGLAVVSDNCDASPVVTQSPASGSTVTGTTTVTLTVTDASGNQSSTTFDVALEDDTAPTIGTVADQTQDINGTCSGLLSDYTSLAVVSDNCDASPVVTQSPAIGATVTGITAVTLTVTDASGNENSTSFNVSLVDVSSISGVTEACYGEESSIEVSTSTAGVSYTLRNNDDNSEIGEAVYGNGSALSLPTGTLTEDITYNVFAQTAPLESTSLNLDGIDDRIGINTGGAVVSGEYTVEAWLKPNSISGAMTILSTRLPNETSFDFKLQNGNLIHGDIGSGSTWITTTADATFNYDAGTWYHIAYVVTTTGYTIYVDGQAIGSGNFSATPLLTDSGHPILIGGYSPTVESFNGQIDELRIWNVERTAQEIQDNYQTSVNPSQSGLFAYYDFNDGTGSSVLSDLTSNNYDGTLSMVDVNTAWVTDPINDRVSCSVELSNTVSVSVTKVDTSVTQVGEMLTANATGESFQWLNCSDFSVISGETNESFIATADGSYAVEVTQNSCVDTSKCVSFVVTGINTPSESSLLSVYPNPTNGLVHFETLASWTLSNAQGQVLQTGEETTLDLSSYEQGIYFLQVENGGTVKLLKE